MIMQQCDKQFIFYYPFSVFLTKLLLTTFPVYFSGKQDDCKMNAFESFIIFFYE